MHIVILGDSWGEPNWRGPMYPGFTQGGHTAPRLEHMGHTVYNYSESGRSNMNTWLRLKVRPPPRADVAIWFHTEIARDIARDHRPGSLSKTLNHTADWVYSRCSQIQTLHLAGVPLIVIEGQSRLHQPQFDRYFNKDQCPQASGYTLIPDWRAELLGQTTLPYTPLLVMLMAGGEILGDFTDDLEEKSQWITDTEYVVDLMKHSPMFPDNCHPGDLAHEQLVNRLIKLFPAER
jgi:hypothetical protein